MDEHKEINQDSHSSKAEKKRRARELKRKKIILTLGILLAAFFLGTGFLKALPYTESPDFCKSCHTMKPYHISWIQSGHTQTSCYDCHISSGKKVIVKSRLPIPDRNYWNLQVGDRTVNVTSQMRYFREKVEQFNKFIDYTSRQAQYVPIKLIDLWQIADMTIGGRKNGAQLTWQSCTNCHSDLMSRDSKTDSSGHSEHMKNGLTCSECHGDVTHENIVKLKREDCNRCHDSRPPKPQSHRSAEFITSHGKSYINRDSCRICHPLGPKEKLCVDCHGMEMPHRDRYVEIHKEEIKRVGVRQCQNCHKDTANRSQNNPPPDADMKIPKSLQGAAAKKQEEPSCAKCHGKNLFHKASKALITHGRDAAAKGISGCVTCHKPSECKDCHGVPMPHPKGFLAQHTKETKKPGMMAKCDACHLYGSRRAPLCVSCHGVQMPHTSEFWPNHGSGDLGRCRLCHSSKNPANKNAPWANDNFCDKCHGVTSGHADGHDVKKFEERACLKCHVERIGCVQCHW